MKYLAQITFLQYATSTAITQPVTTQKYLQEFYIAIQL